MKISSAVRHARQELYNRKGRRAYFNQIIDLEDWLLPLLFQNQAQQLLVRDFTPEEAAAYYSRQAMRYTPLQPSYGFVGRDLDILQIEKFLLTRRNILLVRGMGGVGKTTLLQHLGSWWQTAGYVDQVFYFGYDERSWTCQQILTLIAQRILTSAQYLQEFQPPSPEDQQAMLSKRLRDTRHLVILDNLESITGAQMVIQHTLSLNEQAALRRLLVDLTWGKTFVLLGSRSDESWLARETFADNVYDLGGLDPEAASMLANLILDRYGTTKYRQDADFQKLLKILNGFPLALEVVLSNLVRQTPTEIFSALNRGDLELDVGDSQEKTKSILRCIDYSYSNLSRGKQDLLICLAPFTSVIHRDVLNQYITYLQQQSDLDNLSSERIEEVVQEAINWGLMSPDPSLSFFLHLQPTLPYSCVAACILQSELRCVKL